MNSGFSNVFYFIKMDPYFSNILLQQLQLYQTVLMAELVPGAHKDAAIYEIVDCVSFQ